MRLLKGSVSVLVMATVALAGCEVDKKEEDPKRTRLSEVRRYDTAGNLLSVGKVSWPSAGELRMQTTLTGSSTSWQERVCKYNPSATGLPMVDSAGGYVSLISSIPPATVASMGWPQTIDGTFCQRAWGSTIVLEDSYTSGVSNAVTQTVTVTRPTADVMVQTQVINLTPTETYGYTDTVTYKRDDLLKLLYGRIVQGAVGTAPSSPTGTMAAATYGDYFTYNAEGRISNFARRTAPGVDAQWLTSDDVVGKYTSYAYLGDGRIFSIGYGQDAPGSGPTHAWRYVYDEDVLREQYLIDASSKVLQRWIYENY